MYLFYTTDTTQYHQRLQYTSAFDEQSFWAPINRSTLSPCRMDTTILLR